MDPVIVITLRLCFALLFATAALHKVRDPLGFRDTLERYEIVPGAWVGPAGVLLMGAEMAIAAAMPFFRWPALAAVLVLAAYAAAISVNLARGRTDLGCGCMGPAASAPISGWLVARNGLLIVLAAALWPPARSRPLIWVDGFTIAAAVATLTLLWLAAERLLMAAPALARLRSAGR